MWIGGAYGLHRLKGPREGKFGYEVLALEECPVIVVDNIMCRVYEIRNHDPFNSP